MAKLSQNFCRWQTVELGLKSRVYSVKRKKAMLFPGAPPHCRQLGQTHSLGFSHTVGGPAFEVAVNSCVLQFVPEEYRLYGIERTREIKEHDPYRALRFLQVQSPMEEEDDGIHWG